MSLNRTGKWNPGGGRWIEIVPAVALASYTISSVASAPTVVLSPSWSFTRIYCTPGTLQYRESKKNTDNGFLHDLEIKGFSPDDSPDKRAQIENLAQYQTFLVRFQDTAGLTRLAGTKIEPLLLEFELSTDSDVPGSRGYNLSFSGTLTAPAAYE
ncbi:hypothetical protein [Larkinella insperata]|nr:hypothetical protein [Larkinella insperata]